MRLLPAQDLPNLILFDSMVPGRDVLVIGRKQRSFSSIPTTMIIARVEAIDRLRGRPLDVDDHVRNSFAPREVVILERKQVRRINRPTRKQKTKECGRK